MESHTKGIQDSVVPILTLKLKVVLTLLTRLYKGFFNRFKDREELPKECVQITAFIDEEI